MALLAYPKWFKHFLKSAAFFVVFGAFAVCDVGLYLHRMNAEMSELSEFKKQFAPEVIEASCPKEKYRTHYACFRDHSKTLIDQKWENTGSVVLMAIGVALIGDDHKQSRCQSQQECDLNFVELILGLTEVQINQGKPALWNPSPVRQMIRVSEVDFGVMILEKMDFLMTKAQSHGSDLSRLPASTPIVDSRLPELVKRYENLRPKIVEYARKDAAYEFIKKYF